jgi:integrase
MEDRWRRRRSGAPTSSFTGHSNKRSGWGWIRTNPAHKAQVPRIPAPDIRRPAPSELVRLFALAEEADPPIAAFLWVAAATGARRSELLALRWSDIDGTSSRMTIARGLVNGPDGFVVKDTKTHGVRHSS